MKLYALAALLVALAVAGGIAVARLGETRKDMPPVAQTVAEWARTR